MGHFTDYYPVGARIVSFRYSQLVTVPGKGGRPRKWTSDADRVRAFRARQRGDEEPPNVDVAYDRGDEAAAAWKKVHQIGDELARARAELREQTERAERAERALANERHRADWLASEHEQLRSDLEAIRRRLDGQSDGGSAPTVSEPTAGAPTPNRAARRRAERDARRRSTTD